MPYEKFSEKYPERYEGPEAQEEHAPAAADGSGLPADEPAGSTGVHHAPEAEATEPPGAFEPAEAHHAQEPTARARTAAGDAPGGRDGVAGDPREARDGVPGNAPGTRDGVPGNDREARDGVPGNREARDGVPGHVRLVDAGQAAALEERVHHAALRFVDGPEEAAREMDAVLAEAGELFGQALAARREGLRHSWDADRAGDGNGRGGDGGSATEDLRRAVQQYRDLVRVLIDA